VAGQTPVRAGTAGGLPGMAWKLGSRATYGLEVNGGNAGAALEWAKTLGLYASVRELRAIHGAAALERALVFVPALTGPSAGGEAAGQWFEKGPDTSNQALLQAVLEGVALRAAQAVAALDARLPLVDGVRVDGGITLIPYFREFLCRALNRPVAVASTPDLTGLGCAQFAFLGAGHGPLETLPPVPPPDHVLHPEAPLPAPLQARFQAAVEQSQGLNA